MDENAGSGVGGGLLVTVAEKVLPLKPSARVVLGAAALLLANWSYAAELFLPVESAGAEDRDAAPAANAAAAERRTSAVGGAWERRVRVARNELARVRDEVEKSGEGRLLLNVNADVDLDMVVERTASTPWGYSLSGRIEGRSAGFVTLVVHPQAVSASIWTPDASYQVVPLGGGVHAVRDVTNEPPAECAGAVHPEHPELATSDARPAQGAADDVSVVDILVVWTPAREEEHGGEALMKLEVDRRVTGTNDAFERSGAFVSLNLVSAKRVDYEEEDWHTDFRRLVDPADGHMDSVHILRNTLGADLVHLLTLETAGLAQLLGAFSMNVTSHEIGHSMGLSHDRYTGIYLDGRLSHGYAFAFAGGGKFCELTAVSYSARCKASGTAPHGYPFFSSPWRYSSVGEPLGVSRFGKQRALVDGPADAVLALNRNRHEVANWRQSRSGTD